MRLGTPLALVLIAACTVSGGEPLGTEPSGDTSPVTSSSPTTVAFAGPRLIETTVSVGSDGSSETVAFVVPSDTRSIGVSATGGTSDVIGVAELTLADTTDRVGINRIPVPLLENIATQHVRLLPGDVFQEASVGVHGFVFPNAPLDAEIPPGEAQLRLVSTGRSLDVTIVLPPVADDRVLPLDVFVTDSDLSLEAGSPALARAADLLGQAGISVRWDTVESLDLDEPLIRVEGSTGVRGPIAELVAAGSATGTDALDVFVVSRLPVSGLSPRIPGPTTQSPLRAVIVKSTQRPSDLGRVIAHEVAHYLGLHHLELYTDDNRAIPDPIPDTSPGDNNLMSGGTILTDGQIDVLRRSPLLEPSS